MEETLFDLSPYESEACCKGRSTGKLDDDDPRFIAPTKEFLEELGRKRSQAIAPSPKIHGYLNAYTPGGTASKKNLYYRLSYRHKGRLRHKHVPGGNIKSYRAVENYLKIEKWLQKGISPVIIVERMRNL